MKQIITTQSIGIKTNLSEGTGIVPFLHNDSICVSDDINFCFSLDNLNFKRVLLGSSVITEKNITSYKLIVFVCDDIVSENFVNVISAKIYDLSILQNYVNTDISSSFVNHDTLSENMSYDELLSLCKQYKVIFRITNNLKDIQNLSLKTADVVNDFNLILDTTKNGPYDVNCETIDLVSPQEFTSNERLTIYQNHLNLFGYEGLRVLYPQNILYTNQQMPIVCIQHGVKHEHQGYDIYASKLASYGYFVCMLQQETYGGGETYFGNYHILGKLRHLKNNITKISAGKFQNNLNFSKISLMGHSQGGNKVYTACSEVGITTENDIDINDIMCLILVNPAIAVPNSGAGFRSTINTPQSFYSFQKDVPLLVLGSDRDDAVRTIPYDIFSNYGLDANFRNKNYKRLISFRNSFHGGPILDFELLNYTNLPSQSPFDTRFLYNFNSKANSIGFASSDVLLFLSLCLKNKVNNYLKNTSYHSLNEISKKQRECVVILDHCKSSDVLTIIDEFSSSNPNLSHGGFNQFTLQTQSAVDVFNTLDAFEGVLSKRAGTNSGGLRIDYNNDSFIQYQNTTDAYNINNCNFIEVYCSQILEDVYNDKINDKHFCLELVDSARNSAIISSKVYNYGVPAQTRNIYPTAETPYTCISPTSIKFKLQDFLSKNPLLDTTDITKIILRFGSTYGSSSGALAIHRIQTTI